MLPVFVYLVNFSEVTYQLVLTYRYAICEECQFFDSLLLFKISVTSAMTVSAGTKPSFLDAI